MAELAGHELPAPDGFRLAAPGLDPPEPEGVSVGGVVGAVEAGSAADGFHLDFGRDNKAGGELPGAFDDLQGQVIVWPPSFDVGNVSDAINIYGYAWNTHLQISATVTAIIASGTDGIEQAGLDALDTIKQTLDATITYTVNPTGPLVIDATYLYDTDLGDGSHRIIGSRGVALLSRPLVAGYSERWTFDTDIFRALDGKDSAVSLFASGDEPRASVRFPAAALSRLDLARLENVLRFAGRYGLAVPLWWSLSRLDAATDGSAVISCPTSMRRFLAGRSVLLLAANAPINPKFSIRQAAAIAADSITLNAPIEADAFSSGDLVVPVLPMQAKREQALSMINSRFARGSLDFEELM